MTIPIGLFVDDSDDDLEDASMDVDRLPVPQREFDEVAERILDRIRQGQTDYQAVSLIATSLSDVSRLFP